MEKVGTADFIDRSNWRGGLALFRDWSIIVTAILVSLHINNFYFYLFSIVIIGCCQFAIGDALLHEACHGHLFKSKWLNENLSFLYAEPFFYTLLIYRESHLPHHLYFESDKDPSRGLYKQLGMQEKSRSFYLQFFKICLGRASLVHLDYFIYWYPIHLPWRVILFWLPVLVSFYSFGGIYILILYWIIPYIFIFPVLLYWNIIVNHYSTETGTRTLVNPLSNFINHNNGYHYIHHLCPAIPWYKLEAAYQILGSENTDVTKNFLDSFKQVRSAHLAK